MSGPSQASTSGGPRSRLDKQKEVNISSPSHFGGHLTFTKVADKERYKVCCERRIIPCKFIHDSTLDTLNIKDEVTRRITTIGWTNYTVIALPAFIDLTWEFYATFEFNLPAEFSMMTPNFIRYCLMGKEFQQSIIEFYLAFGFIDMPYSQSLEYVENACDFIEPFFYRNTGYWKDLSVDTHSFDPSQSKSSYLKNPVFCYIHRFLNYSFSGRKDSSGILSKPKFFFI